MKKATLLKCLFAGTLALMVAVGFLVTGNRSRATALAFTLEENQVIAAVTSEAHGTCCDGGGTCIIGNVAIAHAYKIDDGKPCP